MNRKGPRRFTGQNTGDASPQRADAQGLARQHYERGLACAKLGRVAEAATAYREALALQPAFPEACNNLGNALLTLGRPAEAAAAYEKAIALRPQLAEAHNNLGSAFLAQGRLAEALAAFEAAIAARPAYADAYYNLGGAFAAHGRFEEAVSAYRQAIALRAVFPEAYNNLANVLMAVGRIEEAAAAARAALALSANFPEAHNNLGNALLMLDRPEEAAAAFQAAIAVRPVFPAAYCNLGNALILLERSDDALAAYRQAVAQQPNLIAALNSMSSLLLQMGRKAEALAAGRESARVSPESPESHFNLANALRETGAGAEALEAYGKAAALAKDDAKMCVALANTLMPIDEPQALALFRRAHALRPLAKIAARKVPADFSVLLLTAPGPSNTAADYIIGRGGYDSYFLVVMEGIDFDYAMLRRHGDVVVNLISDVDLARGRLALAADIVERVGRPVVNDARKVAATGREAIAEQLRGVASCRIPRTRRVAGHALAGPRLAESLQDFAFPLLVRLSGTHGGADFEKVETPEAVVAFAAREPDADYYLTEYVPYESTDGYFRKYRLVFVDGEIFPYHLAIADQWKVHHFRTDMANQKWMRDEEEAFVRAPDAVLAPAHWQALREIGTRIALDYFGVDCGFDRSGDMVIFEINATMRIHGEKGVFAYKQPYVERIKHAFDAMLTKRAGR